MRKAVANYGASCRIRMYEDANLEGESISFDSKFVDKKWYDDTKLSDGAGVDDKSDWNENWNDRLSSHQWVDCT